MQNPGLKQNQKVKRRSQEEKIENIVMVHEVFCPWMENKGTGTVPSSGGGHIRQWCSLVKGRMTQMCSLGET